MAVKVILQQDVPNLGQAGEVKQVAPGYFRNFLLPRGLAIEASRGQMRAQEAHATSRKAQQARSVERMSAVARQLQDVTIRIPVKLGEQGRIYGSVTKADISQALAQQADVSIDRHKIELGEPLRALGVHSVPIKLEHGADANVRVELVPEEDATQT